MKIFIVNTLYPPIVVGGAEKSVALLAGALAARGHEVEVASLHPGDEAVTEEIDGVRVHRLPLDNLYWPFDQDRRPDGARRIAWHLRDVWNAASAKRIKKLLKRVSPDVMHTNNLTGFSVAAWAAAREAAVPIVHTLRDYSLLCRRATLFRAGRNCNQRCVECVAFSAPAKLATGHVGDLVSNSQFVLDLHQREGFFARARREVIFNIMDLPSGGRRRSSTSTSGPTTFGFIGKISAEKGVEVALQAVSRLPQANWRLLIAGKGDPEYVRKLQADHPDPRIEWAGFVDTAEFFSRVDVCLISSIWYEPLPRTLIEAISYGVPTIAAKSGGIPEIAHSSQLIGLYEPEDSAELAALMVKVMQEPTLRGKAAPPDAVDVFKPAAVAEQYEAAYRRAVARNT